MQLLDTLSSFVSKKINETDDVRKACATTIRQKANRVKKIARSVYW